MSTMLTLLASDAYRYVPFQKPAPLWDVWPFLLIPLCLGIAIVYKSVRCQSMKQVPRQALELWIVILVVMALAAVSLAALTNVLAR